MSQEMREKISKPVIQIDPTTLNAIARFSSMSEASNETGIDFSTISSVCRRKSSTAGGFFWCFEDEYDDSMPTRLNRIDTMCQSFFLFNNFGNVFIFVYGYN